MKKAFIFLPILFLIASCTTKVLRPDLQDQITETPQIEDYHDRWFLGFVRNTFTDPKLACVNETPVKTTDLLSLEDFLLSAITFGIYTPATTRVWCVYEGVSEQAKSN